MEKISIRVDVARPQMPPPPRRDEASRLDRLEEKIDYAIECIECELDNCNEAIDFLTRLYFKMDATPRQSKRFARLQEKVYATLAPHGIDFTKKEDSNAKA